MGVIGIGLVAVIGAWAIIVFVAGALSFIKGLLAYLRRDHNKE